MISSGLPHGALGRAARELGPVGVFAAAALVVTVILLGAGLVRVIGAVLASAPAQGEQEVVTKQRAERFLGAFEGHLAQIRGRSMFFTPPEPPPPPRPRDEAAAREPEADPKPTSYAGPGIVAMVNGAVWFDNGQRLVLGEDDTADLVVVSVSPPWSARLRWAGVEFEVPLFDRTTSRFMEPPEAEQRQAPADPTADSDPPNAAETPSPTDPAPH